jgi:CRP/FNR family transcriptional regulator, cyclic AMP receptor protein
MHEPKVKPDGPSLEPLQQITIFAGLDPAALTRLLSKAVRLEVPEGQVVVREGESGNQFYLLLTGAARVVKAFETVDAVELAQIKAGDFFGEMCLLETLPRVATVQTTSASVILRLSALAFLDLYDSRPDQHSLLILNLARDLSRRLRRLDEAFAARH